jgi:hypothetical protein
MFVITGNIMKRPAFWQKIASLSSINPLTTQRRLLYLKGPVRTAQFISVIKTNQYVKMVQKSLFVLK